MANNKSSVPPSGKKWEHFENVINSSEVFSKREFPEKGIVEFIGRVQKSDEKGKFILRILSGVPGFEHILEMDVRDVKEYESIFEDSAGRKTFRIRLPQDALIKLILPGEGIPKQFEPKQFDPKQFDPKSDPKQFDPKQFDPKSDPKQFEPKQFDPKQFDPKSDPKQFEPKMDPGSFGPFVLMTPWGTPKQFGWEFKRNHPIFDSCHELKLFWRKTKLTIRLMKQLNL